VFTIQQSDERFADWKDYDDNSVDVSGGAAARIQINDPDLRAAYREGEWDGVSLFGPAAVEQVDIVAASQRVAARMGGIPETEMTKDELQAILDAQKKNFAELAKSMKDILAAKSENDSGDNSNDGEGVTATSEEKPTFTGDVNDAQALADYESALRGFELRKSVASGDMSADDIAEMRKSMSEAGPTVDDLKEAGIDAKAGDSKDVRALQVKLFKAQKGTNVPSRRTSSENPEDVLAKAAQDEGLAIAKIMNEQLGNGPADGGMRLIS